MSETTSTGPQQPVPEPAAPVQPGAAAPVAQPEATGSEDLPTEPPAPEPIAAEDTVAEPAQAQPVEPETEQPAAQEAVPAELISPELAPRLTLDDVEPPAPVAPDLEAVPVQPPASLPPTAPGLDLPGVDYAEQSARMAYGQPGPQPPADSLPPVPPAPPADPYAASPYAAQAPYEPQPSYPAQAPYAEPAQPYGQPQYGQSQYAQPQFGQAPAYPVVPYQQQLSAAEEGTWSSAAHWSAIVASFVGLGFLGPLLVLLIQGPKSARVRANAVESLNFEITYVLAMIASVLLMLVVIGFVTIFLVPLVWLILRIVASVQTSSGNDYRYPVNIRLVK